MNEKQRGSSTGAKDTGDEKPPGIFSVHGVRYQVTDVARGPGELILEACTAAEDAAA